jgi:glycogen(starch) synthase
MLKVLMNADTIGGVWTYAIELIAALGSHDVEIVLCSTGRLPTPEQRQVITAQNNVRLLETAFKLEWMEDPWDDVIKTRQWLQEIATAERPDLIHLNDYAHAAADWEQPVLVVGHSCVLSWHEAVRGRPAGKEWATYRDAVAAGLRQADAVVAPSSAMLESLKAHYGPLQRATVIYNGLRRTPLTQPIRKRRQVLTAGRLWDEAKNVVSLVRAANQIHAPVLLAGDHASRGDSRCASQNVTYLGRLSPHALAQRYSESAIYALPARYEPFGYTPLEAALQGCALVLGDIPSLREIWQDAACYVPPDDDQALANSINELLNCPDRFSRQVAAAQKRAATFLPDTMASAYLTLYQQLCSTTKTTGNNRKASCAL